MLGPAQLSPSQLCCKLDRFNKAPRIRHALSGNVESRAMIHRRSDDRKSHSEIHALAKRHQFQGNQALVMKHGDHTVIASPHNLPEERISWQGIAGLDSRGSCFVHGGKNVSVLFITEETPLAGMRIQRGNTKSGSPDPEMVTKSRMGKTDGLADLRNC